METPCPTVELTHQVFLGHLHVPEHQSPRAPTPAPHESVKVRPLHPRPAVNNDKAQFLILVSVFIKVRPAVYQEKIRALGPHHKAFHPVQHEMIALELRPGHGPEEIRPAPGLGERFRRNAFSLQIRFQVRFFLLFGAEYVECLPDNGWHNESTAQGHP